MSGGEIAGSLVPTTSKGDETVRVMLRRHMVLIALVILVTMLAGCGAQTAAPPKAAEPAKDTRGVSYTGNGMIQYG